MAEDEGKYCYFHRDLAQGCYGGDVACLQQHLRREVLCVSLVPLVFQAASFGFLDWIMCLAAGFISGSARFRAT